MSRDIWHIQKKQTPKHTHMHATVFCAMSCQSLLGLALLLAGGLDPLSEKVNLGPFSLSTFRECRELVQAVKEQTERKQDRQEVRAKKIS